MVGLAFSGLNDIVCAPIIGLRLGFCFVPRSNPRIVKRNLAQRDPV